MFQFQIHFYDVCLKTIRSSVNLNDSLGKLIQLKEMFEIEDCNIVLWRSYYVMFFNIQIVFDLMDTKFL